MERTETGFELLPEGTYDFTITEAADKRRTQKGKIYYLFRMNAVVNGRVKKHSEAIMTWMAGDILRALGCTEVEKDVFEWDKAEIVNRKFRADIVHEPDFKDNTKKVARLKNFKQADIENGEEPEPPPEEPAAPQPSDKEEIPF